MKTRDSIPKSGTGAVSPDRLRGIRSTRVGKPQAFLQRRAAIGKEKRTRTRAMLLRAAFDLLGREQGRITQVDEVVAQAGITRGTFYNYFSSLSELYNGLSFNLTHEFNAAVYEAMVEIETPAEQASMAVRSYLRQTVKDRQWGWGMVNISSCGPMFGIETFEHAKLTAEEGLMSGDFTCGSAEVGRDIQLGGLLAGMIALLQGASLDYGNLVTIAILRGLGVSHERALSLITLPLPSFHNLKKLGQL